MKTTEYGTWVLQLGYVSFVVHYVTAKSFSSTRHTSKQFEVRA